MPVFTYQPVEASSTELCGALVADSAREAPEKLRSQGLYGEPISEQLLSGF